MTIEFRLNSKVYNRNDVLFYVIIRDKFVAYWFSQNEEKTQINC